MRRPSFAAIVAMLALFVALGGPAEAQRLLGKGDVRSREVKDRSLKLRDLERRTVRALRATVNNSITEAKLANGSVTPGKLAPGAVGSAAIGDRSVATADLMTGAVGGAQVADGSLSAADLGRFYGRFRLSQPIPALGRGTCWAREPAGLAPELARADISQDLVIVTPDAGWPEAQLTFTVSNSADPSRFVLAACNPTIDDSSPVDVGFRYLVVDLP
jgi:hypothetical protein